MQGIDRDVVAGGGGDSQRILSYLIYLNGGWDRYLPKNSRAEPGVFRGDSMASYIVTISVGVGAGVGVFLKFLSTLER